MNLLLVIPDLWNGGAQKSFLALVKAYAKENTVSVVVFDEDFDMAIDGVQYFNLQVGKSNTPLRKALNFFRRIRKLRKIKQQLKIDVCISFLEGANYINVLSGVGKVILSIRGSKLHDQNINGLKGRIRKRILIPYIYKRANVLVPLGNGVAKELTDVFSIDPDKISVIPNFFNENLVLKSLEAPLKPELQYLSHQEFILAIGRLAPEKGYIELLHAFKALLEIRAQTKLVIAGEGPMHENLIQCCKELGLSIGNSDSNVLFLNHVDNVFPLLKETSCYVFTSRHEGFGRVLLEALLAQTPILANDCPYGPQEVLIDKAYNKYAEIVPLLEQNDQSVTEFNSALIEILEGRYRYNLDKGYQHALSFRESIIIKQWLKILNHET